VCLITDLHNREILGYSAGPYKTADLVHKAFSTIKYNLRDIQIFHTDYTEENIIPKIHERLSKCSVYKFLFNIVFHINLSFIIIFDVIFLLNLLMIYMTNVILFHIITYSF